MTEETTIKKSQEQFPNATPRPWKINGATFIWSPDGHSNVAAASDPRPPNNSSVGYYEIRPWDASKDADKRFRETCANAELIVTAVNSYDALREAATEAIKVLKLDFPGSIKRKSAIAKLEAALVDTNTTEEVE